MVDLMIILPKLDIRAKNPVVSAEDVNVRVSNQDAEGSGAYVVPFSVQSMITQTDKSGKQIKLASSVSTYRRPLLFPLSSLFFVWS